MTANLRRFERARVLIAGAGTAGQSLANEVEASGDLFVGFLDDSVRNDRVLGCLADLAEVAAIQAVDVLYLAMPSAPPEKIRDLVSQARSLDLEIAIVPRTYRIVAKDRVSVNDLTDIDVLDLVGRAPVKHDMLSARDQIRGRRVLVTGAAGSIGSRVLSQLAALEPALIVGVDRAESPMFHLGMQLSSERNLILEIADVQSSKRIDQLMESHRPDYVFHVAAYKHVPLMESNPIEAFNNNVWGTLNVLRSAAEHAASRVVYVSTDKAVNPANVMGATKRIGELLLHDLSDVYPSTVFSAVRFGNVLESEGSVMQIFRRQLSAGKNLTVTHPEITRFFMTIDEAAQLVIQTASLSTHDDLFVLDMGEPIRVIDLAQGLIDAVNPALEIDIIGLRPGEKMYEELSYAASEVDHTSHPKILIVKEHNVSPSGTTLEWVQSLLPRTRDYSISAAKLRSQIAKFGFEALES